MEYSTPPGTPVPIDNPNKNDTEHPAIAGTLWQHSYVTTRSSVAEIDYDLEPYTTYSANESHANKSKPASDLRDAQDAETRYEARKALQAYFNGF